LAAASILAFPSSFARSVTSEASLDLDSTASAKAKSPERSEHPTATNPSAVATLLSVLPGALVIIDLVVYSGSKLQSCMSDLPARIFNVKRLPAQNIAMLARF